MPQAYNSAACTSELITEEKVRLAVTGGWRSVPGATLAEMVSSVASSSGSRVLVPVGRQVLVFSRRLDVQRVHWHEGGNRTVCGRVQCCANGSPVNNVVMFAENAWQWPPDLRFPWCQICLHYGGEMVQRGVYVYAFMSTYVCSCSLSLYLFHMRIR